jgi:hypothetical protein
LAVDRRIPDATGRVAPAKNAGTDFEVVQRFEPFTRMDVDALNRRSGLILFNNGSSELFDEPDRHQPAGEAP